MAGESCPLDGCSWSPDTPSYSERLAKAEQERDRFIAAADKLHGEWLGLKAELVSAQQETASVRNTLGAARMANEQLRKRLGEAEWVAGRDIADPPNVDLIDRITELRTGREQATAHALELAKELQTERGKNGRLATELGEMREPGPDVIASHVRYLCETCGARYGIAFTDHEHGPLTAVTVTIARQGAPTE
ncbi:MAG: hypothetical protein JWO11_4470 [Nocardioides sp.]|nr:hypothetical protein [Nocardioides sp.]